MGLCLRNSVQLSRRKNKNCAFLLPFHAFRSCLLLYCLVPFPQASRRVCLRHSNAPNRNISIVSSCRSPFTGPWIFNVITHWSTCSSTAACTDAMTSRYSTQTSSGPRYVDFTINTTLAKVWVAKCFFNARITVYPLSGHRRRLQLVPWLFFCTLCLVWNRASGMSRDLKYVHLCVCRCAVSSPPMHTQ